MPVNRAKDIDGARSDDRVAGFINENFIPVKIHVKEQPQAFGRFDAQWTPTLIALDPQSQDRGPAADTAREFRQRYSDTVRARKAPVRGPATAGKP